MDNIQEIKITDPEYPDQLKQIKNPPAVLYCRGVFINPDEKTVAIVGTRHPSDYGQRATIEISSGLMDAGLTIISGMAPGIDTFAHQTAVENKKRTIAVLGTGLDEKSLYPKQNLELSRKIIVCGGCLISELPPGTPGSKFTFPKRNRIVSALSLGVVVIEAKEKSGSLITADYALQQKKKLFAIPGSIFALNAKGPNGLIKKGAILVEGANDILETLNLKTKNNQQELLAESEEEKLILGALTQESLYIDKIIEKTKLAPSAVSTALALMEISGKIRNLGGNIYSIK